MNSFQKAIYNNVSIEQNTGCWIWMGCSTGHNGRVTYSQVNFLGKRVMTHRASYELFVGPIPEGLTIDHKCRHPWCVNPAHLRPMTGVENTMLGNNPWAVNARKMKCKRGHTFTSVDHRGHRECTECRRDIYRRYRERKASKVLLARHSRGVAVAKAKKEQGK